MVYKTTVGINKLKEIIPQLFLESGLEVRYTNHSLRVTAMTRMFNSGVPEKIIGEKSGHRSLEALRCYEHTSKELERSAGDIIVNPKKLNPLQTRKRKYLPSKWISQKRSLQCLDSLEICPIVQ